MYDIENLFLFNGLDSADREEIISSLAKPCLFTKGSVIFSADNFQTALGVFLSGNAQASAENVLKRNFSAGDVFGAASMFGAGEKYISDITAVTDCEVCFIGQDELEVLFARFPSVAVNYITFLSGRVRYLNQKIKLYTCRGAAEKLYLYLCSNADDDNIVHIGSMSSLAKLTSIGRTSLYRAVDELTQSGLIERENTTIKVK